MVINAGTITLKTDDADYLNRLSYDQGNAAGEIVQYAYKIGKGTHFTKYVTFRNADGTGDWEGVKVYVNDVLTSSTEGVGQ